MDKIMTTQALKIWARTVGQTPIVFYMIHGPLSPRRLSAYCQSTVQGSGTHNMQGIPLKTV
jgi:hypothetical protein